MKRKRKTSLPRVTLLSFNRRDLLAFAEAVEALRLIVADLAAVAAELRNAATARRRPSTPAKPRSGDSVDREAAPQREGGAP